MTCKEFVELVTEYLEGRLPAPDRARFEQHIEACHWCGRYLEQMKATIRTVGRLEEHDLSPEAKAELLKVFRDWGAERS